MLCLAIWALRTDPEGRECEAVAKEGRGIGWLSAWVTISCDRFEERPETGIGRGRVPWALIVPMADCVSPLPLDRPIAGVLVKTVGSGFLRAKFGGFRLDNVRLICERRPIRMFELWLR